MKRLFFSVFAIALGAFAFISCDDEDKIRNEEEKNAESYLSLSEQQKTIQGAIEGVADAIQFTEFSQALDVVSGVIGREIGLREILGALASPEVQEDPVFLEKLGQAVAMAMFGMDTIVLDLSPLYMSADLFITDTILIDTVNVDTTYQTILTIANIKHDVNCLQLNVFVDDHQVELKVKAKAGESIVTIKNEEDGIRSIILPESAEISIALDGKTLAELNGGFKSDCSLYVESVEDGDDVIRFEGTQASVSGSLKVLNYALEGSLNFEKEKGADGKLIAKYADNEILSVNAKLNADFEGLDLIDTTAVLVWAQNPEKLQSVGLSASLASGKVEIKGTVENPFKDEELATTLRSLMVPGVTLSEEKAKQTIDKLNAIIDAGIYFEGYKDAQAKFQFIYDKDGGASQANSGSSDNDPENEALDAIEDVFRRIGLNTVFIVHNDEGVEETIPVENYFRGIDVTKFTQTVSEKFMQAFGPIMAEINADE